MRQVGEEAEDDQQVGPDEDALEHLGGRAVAEEARQRIGDRRPRCGPLVEAERDPRRVPEQQRGHDPGDQGQDQVGLAQVTALEARRALDLADHHRADHAGQHQHGEEVDHQRKPALVPEPGQRGLAVHGSDHRDHDRGEEDEEAPEDRRVDQPRHQPLQQLALPEHDRRLVAHALGHVVEALGRLAEPDQVHEQLGPAGEQEAADRQQGGKRQRSRQDVYAGRAFLSSALIAGTISLRSPITA